MTALPFDDKNLPMSTIVPDERDNTWNDPRKRAPLVLGDSASFHGITEKICYVAEAPRNGLYGGTLAELPEARATLMMLSRRTKPTLPQYLEGSSRHEEPRHYGRQVCGESEPWTFTVQLCKSPLRQRLVVE